MRRLRLFGLTSLLGLVVSVQPAGSVTTAVFHRPIVSVGANQSQNWSGYNQGILEQGKGPFNAVSGDWIVPTATAHKRGQAAFSSTWTGIGGGCLDTSCSQTDATLIQAGTEQDVDASGKASYSAWWETIPGPSVTFSDMTIKPGDHMRVTIGQAAPEVWTITVRDLSRNETGAQPIPTQSIPYTSDFSTAEWIEETPLIIDTSGSGVASLPNLSTVHFTNATANSANPKLKATEEIQLVDSGGATLATPSAPNATTNGFDVCAYAKSCATPSSSSTTTTSIGSTRHTRKS